MNDARNCRLDRCTIADIEMESRYLSIAPEPNLLRSIVSSGLIDIGDDDGRPSFYQAIGNRVPDTTRRPCDNSDFTCEGDKITD